MIDFGINIKLDDGDVTSSVKGLKSMFKGLGFDVMSASDAMDDLKKTASDITAFEKLADDVDDFGISLDKQVLKVEKLSSTYASQDKKIANSYKNKEQRLKRYAKQETSTLERIKRYEKELAGSMKLSNAQRKVKLESMERAKSKISELKTKTEDLTTTMKEQYKLSQKKQTIRLEILEKEKIKLTEVQQKNQRYNQELEQSARNLKKAGINTADLSGEQRKLAKQMRNVTQKAARQKNKIQALGKGYKSIGRGIKQTFSGILDITRQVSMAGAAVAGIGGLALNSNKNLAKQAHELKALSSAFNLSTQEMQVWHIGAKSVGIESDKMSDIFKDVSDKIGDYANTGGGEAKDLFEGLKLNIKEFKDLRPDQALLKIGDALDKSGLSKSQKIHLLEGIADDASLLQDLIGDNAKALNKAREAAEDYGQVLTDLEIDELEKADKAWKQIGNRVDGLKTRAGLVFNDMLIDTGAFDWINEQLADLMFNIEWMSRTGELQSWMDDISDSVVSTAINIKDGAIAVYDFGEKIFNIGNKIASFVGGWDNLIFGILALKGIIMAGGVVTGLSSIATGITAIGAAAGLTALPVLAVVGAVAALGAAWYFWEDIMAWLETNFPAVHDFFAIDIPNAIDTAVDSFNDALKWVHDLGASLEKLVSTPFKIGVEMGKTVKGTGNIFDAGKALGQKAFGGGRATGGPVSSNKLYEVNELGMPELFSTGGKQYLMPSGDGQVTPLQQAKSGIEMMFSQQNQQPASVGNGRLDIHIESPVPAKVKNLESNGMEINVHTGPMGVFAA